MSSHIDILKWEYELLVKAKTDFHIVHPINYIDFCFDSRIKELRNKIEGFYPDKTPEVENKETITGISSDIPF